MLFTLDSDMPNRVASMAWLRSPLRRVCEVGGRPAQRSTLQVVPLPVAARMVDCTVTGRGLCCGCMAISKEILATIGKVIAGALGIITPVVFFLLDRKKARRSLVFTYKSLIIARAGHNPDQRFRLTFLGKEIRAASSVEVTVINNGGETIQEDDFRGPIEFVFSGAEQVLDFDMFGPFQEGEDPSTRYLNYQTRAVSGSAITTEPVLLNSGDRILLAAKIGDFKGHVEVRARIVGVRSVEYRNSAEATRGRFQSRAALPLFVYVAFAISIVALFSLGKHPVLFVTAMVIGIVYQFVIVAAAYILGISLHREPSSESHPKTFLR